MAKSRELKLIVITPERQLLSENVDSVVLPAHDGELGVLVNRAPLMCELGIGPLRYTQAGRTHAAFVDGGFAQVLDNRVTVLSGHALLPGDVTPDVLAGFQAATQEHAGPSVEAANARQRARRRLSAANRVAAPR